MGGRWFYQIPGTYFQMLFWQFQCIPLDRLAPMVALPEGVGNGVSRPAETIGTSSEAILMRALDDASGAASVAVHSTQCKARESLGHNVYGDATIVEGEAFFSLTYLSGTGTHARIGVAAADGSDQTWGVSLYDGKLQVEPKPPPRSVRDMTTGIDVDEPDPPPEYLKHA